MRPTAPASYGKNGAAELVRWLTEVASHDAAFAWQRQSLFFHLKWGCFTLLPCSGRFLRG